VCDLAFALGKSEEEFYDHYSLAERNQLVATFQSQRDRQAVTFAPAAQG